MKNYIIKNSGEKIEYINTHNNVMWSILSESERIKTIFRYFNLLEKELCKKSIEYSSIKKLHSSPRKKDFIILFDNTEMETSETYYQYGIYKKIIPFLIKNKTSTSISFGDIILPTLNKELENILINHIFYKTDNKINKNDLKMARYSVVILSNLSAKIIYEISDLLISMKCVKGQWKMSDNLDYLIAHAIGNDFCLIDGKVIQSRFVDDGDIESINNDGFSKHNFERMINMESININEYSYSLFIEYNFFGMIESPPLYKNSTIEKNKYVVKMAKDKWEYLAKNHSNIIEKFKKEKFLIDHVKYVLKNSQWTKFRRFKDDNQDIVTFNVVFIHNGVKIKVGLKTGDFHTFYIVTAF